MKLEDDWQCPRCAGGIPNDAQKGEYPGALSRYDNETYVCSECGQVEAMIQFAAAQRGDDPNAAMQTDHFYWYATTLERIINSTTEQEALDTLYTIINTRSGDGEG